ncbi:hypothetical protein BDV93DRAFT_601221 [Ceratobasidium sp. AG-I]|nr:hypothetical protein BDV93DRAFT_601221 [Ceratobasidium sp. AG-I]
MEYRTFTGDDKGQIKSVSCLTSGEVQLSAVVSQTLASKQPIQRLRCYREPDSDSDSGVLAAAQADGHLTTYSYARGSNELKDLSTWKETRLAVPDRFVGLEAVPSKGWLSCTQHGRLRLSYTLGEPSTSEVPADVTASLPMRLNDMRLSPSSSSLAYGGNEVDLSVWDVERTFSEKPSTPGAAANKRKKGKGDLMYAEIWRAKQLANDSLSLRQPVHITSLTFLHNAPTSSAQQPAYHIITGNASGAVRRFDTRAARRPVANWENVAKTGGIRSVECGRNEHEIFVSDNGSNLSSLDTRTGKLSYTYKSLSGAASSFTPLSTTHLASVSLDRIFRLHSVFAPPPKANEQQVKKGAVLGQEFMKSTPTVVVWDGFEVDGKASPGNEEGGEDEDVWEGMEVRGDDEEGLNSDESEEEQEKVQKKRVRK